MPSEIGFPTLTRVVIDMGFLDSTSNSQNCVKSTNKIPPHASDFKKEYLSIIGINKELKYFVDNINDATKGLFESHKVDRIKYFIKKIFERARKGQT